MEMVRNDRCGLCGSIVPSTMMSAAREYYENIPQTLMLSLPARTLLVIVEGCLLSDVQSRIRECPSVRWIIKRDSSEKATYRHSVDAQL